MSGRYLVELAEWLDDAGLDVVRYDGWETRARSSGGYADGRPWGVMWHHTASSSAPEDDASYMCHGSSDAPIANLLIARDGVVWLLAAGATNTNGKGGPWTWSRGTVPLDSMNTYAVGVEIANNGVGERYPVAQIDAAFAVSTTLAARLELAAGDVCTHERYAPTRKVDPATADAVEGPWRPRSSNSSGTWNLDDLVAECSRRAGAPTPGPTPPTPQPSPEENDDMLSGIWLRSNDDAFYAVYTNGTKQWIADVAMLQGVQSLARINGIDDSTNYCDDPGLFAAMGVVIGPNAPGRDEWGNKP